MLRNLFLAIFLFALALPALAVSIAPVAAADTAATDCHGMPVEKQDDDAGEHGQIARPHGCIGCIAPVFAVTPSAALPFITQRALHRELSGTAGEPNIPPPRS